MKHNQKKNHDIQNGYQDTIHQSDTLYYRMKSYEHDINPILAYMPYIIRLDGKNFSKFTRRYFTYKKSRDSVHRDSHEIRENPFDDRFSSSMIKTMNFLLEKTTARTGYTHSDEISLIFAPICTKEKYEENPSKYTHEYNGRALKNCTTIASLCSIRFIFEISILLNLNSSSSDASKGIEIDYNNPPCFDARILVFKEDMEYDIVNHMLWRSVRDCHRNAVLSYALTYFSQKKIMNMNSGKMIDMLEENVPDFKWDDAPIHIKYGVYAKREEGTQEITTCRGKVITIPNKNITNKCFKIKYSDEIYNLLLEKRWISLSESENIKFTSITSDLEYL